MPPGLLGENLTLQGLTEDRLWIGDRLHLPASRAGRQRAAPALCFKFNAAMGFAQAATLMLQSGFCGSYLGVVEPGWLQAGDAIRLEPGPREVNLRELFMARTAPALRRRSLAPEQRRRQQQHRHVAQDVEGRHHRHAQFAAPWP